MNLTVHMLNIRIYSMLKVYKLSYLRTRIERISRVTCSSRYFYLKYDDNRYVPFPAEFNFRSRSLNLKTVPPYRSPETFAHFVILNDENHVCTRCFLFLFFFYSVSLCIYVLICRDKLINIKNGRCVYMHSHS